MSQTHSIKSICVYCASSNTVAENHKQTAAHFGQLMAEQGIRLVFGGGRVGLMGIVAQGVMDHGGTVIGYIPDHLNEAEVGHTGITELHVVDTMHTRKRLMFEQSDAFVVIPGGLGTLDELFEILTWRQLGLHDKPVLILNQDGFWDPLLTLIDHMIAENTARPSVYDLYTVVTDVADILPTLAQLPGPTVDDRPDLL